MDFKLMEMMNYNYVSEGTEFYRIYEKFTELNIEILTEEQLKKAESFLLAPEILFEDRKMTKESMEKAKRDYKRIKIVFEKLIEQKSMENNLEKGKGMAA